MTKPRTMLEEKARAGWPERCQVQLETAITTFKSALPGWWYSLGECDVSCDASCAPTRHAPEHLALIPMDDRFHSGFHVDLPQPSTLAAALMHIREEALNAIDAAAGGGDG